MARTGLALGSNLGDSRVIIQRAINRLLELATPGEPVMIAPVYQTAPLDCPPGSPGFLNTVMEIDYAGTALELLEKTRRIEAALGRDPSPIRNAPRVIDIDLLYFGELSCDDVNLQLPHPRLTQRRFVLEPLADIHPELVLPGQTHTVQELLDQLRRGQSLDLNIC